MKVIPTFPKVTRGEHWWLVLYFIYFFAGHDQEQRPRSLSEVSDIVTS